MSSDSPNVQRGMILLEQRRYADAEKHFRDALAQNPNDPFALYHLAVCQINQDRTKDALVTTESALAIEPEAADFHSLRALILVELGRTKESIESSGEALRLDPDSDYAFTARAAAFLARSEWATAETAARKALEINPDNATAANQLAHALRLQNRMAESAEQTSYMLERDPESASNHSTAGWLALQRGDGRKAEEHFLEALRLEPHNEGARTGLKESFKARSPIYSAYLKYCFFMQRFTAGKQWLIILGMYFGVKVARQVLPGPLALVVVIAYFLLVLWVHVARAVGNFQLMFDRFARHALDRAEKWEASFVGGGVSLGLLLLVGGLLTDFGPLLVLGATLVVAAFPFSYTFTNEAKAGRILFGAIGAFVYVVGFSMVIGMCIGRDMPKWFEPLPVAALFAALLVTWICNIKALYRRA